MRRRAPQTGGFVLIGVVMFVLALTILGMSLYVLSSYEVQFLGASHDDNTALYAAQSGMQEVEDLLADAPYKLESSHTIENTEHIVRATAFQLRPGHPAPDSTGAVDFDSTVTIVVAAKVNGTQRIISGNFKPKQYTSWYKRLFTVADGITCYGSAFAPNDIFGTVHIPAGEQVWQASSDQSWVANATYGPPTDITIKPSIPAPPVSAFLTAHGGAATPPTWNSTTGSVGFANATAAAMFFGVNSAASTPDWDFGPSNGNAAHVQGTCVWIVPQGVRFNNTVTISAATGAPATLVIVAGPNGRYIDYGSSPPVDYRNVGIWFFGGLNVDPLVNVILVSDGVVMIDQGLSGQNADNLAPNLSIYANDVTLLGPWRSYPNTYCTLQHNGVPGQLDAAIDDLMSQGALPVVNGPASTFQLVAGSWQDLGH